MTDNQTACEISQRGDKVFMQLRARDSGVEVEIDPGVAMQIAETLAAAAYTAHHGHKPQNPQKVLAEQVHKRFTAEMRDQMVSRVALMLASLRDQTKSDGYTAMQIVDTILSRAGV